MLVHEDELKKAVCSNCVPPKLEKGDLVLCRRRSPKHGKKARVKMHDITYRVLEVRHFTFDSDKSNYHLCLDPTDPRNNFARVEADVLYFDGSVGTREWLDMEALMFVTVVPE